MRREVTEVRPVAEPNTEGQAGGSQTARTGVNREWCRDTHNYGSISLVEDRGWGSHSHGSELPSLHHMAHQS